MEAGEGPLYFFLRIYAHWLPKRKTATRLCFWDRVSVVCYWMNYLSMPVLLGVRMTNNRSNFFSRSLEVIHFIHSHSFISLYDTPQQTMIQATLLIKKERNRESEIKHQFNNKAKPMLGYYMAYQSVHVFE